MITFDNSPDERAQFGKPLKPKSKGYLVFIVAGAALFFGGVFGTSAILKSGRQIAAQTPVVEHSAQVLQIEEAVTRALSSQAHYEVIVPQGPTPAEVNASCLDALNAVLTPSQTDTQISQLDVARALAREVSGCSMVAITVQGHAVHSTDELVNLQESWQQAQDTIATLAQEGHDTSGFRPLGFGSRSWTPEDTAVKTHITFRISSNL